MEQKEHLTIEYWEDYLAELFYLKDRKAVEKFVESKFDNSLVKLMAKITHEKQLKIKAEIGRVCEIITFMKHIEDE